MLHGVNGSPSVPWRNAACRQGRLSPDTAASQVCLTRDNARFRVGPLLLFRDPPRWRLRAVLTEEAQRAGWGDGMKAAQLMETRDSLDRPNRREEAAARMLCSKYVGKSEIPIFTLRGTESFHYALIGLWSSQHYITEILKGSTLLQWISLILPDEILLLDCAGAHDISLTLMSCLFTFQSLVTTQYSLQKKVA